MSLETRSMSEWRHYTKTAEDLRKLKNQVMLQYAKILCEVYKLLIFEEPNSETVQLGR